jgi:phosphoribosylglycinamide formyltransferase-1
MPIRIAVFASGEGTTLQSIIDACYAGTLDVEIVLVVSNNRDSGALVRARDSGLPWLHLSASTHPDAAELDRAIADALTNAGTDLVVLAGYMKKIGPLTLRRFAGRMLNTHPALLPRYGGKGMYGKRVYEAVLANGEKETGVSIHLVDDEYDTGPVIAQVAIPVEETDTVETLAQRLRMHEKILLNDTLQRIASREIRLGFEQPSD